MNVRLLDTNTDPQVFVGAFGPRWRAGVLSEQLDLFKRAGGVHRPSRSLGAGWAVIEGKAYPVVCSELVRVDTEDGPVSGRCGENALDATGTCAYHDPR